MKLIEEKEAAEAQAKRDAKEGRENALGGPALGHGGNAADKGSRKFF